MKSRISFFSLFNPTFDGGMFARNREQTDVKMEALSLEASVPATLAALTSTRTYGLSQQIGTHQDIICISYVAVVSTESLSESMESRME